MSLYSSCIFLLRKFQPWTLWVSLLFLGLYTELKWEVIKQFNLLLHCWISNFNCCFSFPKVLFHSLLDRLGLKLFHSFCLSISYIVNFISTMAGNPSIWSFFLGGGPKSVYCRLIFLYGAILPPCVVILFCECFLGWTCGNPEVLNWACSLREVLHLLL